MVFLFIALKYYWNLLYIYTNHCYLLCCFLCQLQGSNGTELICLYVVLHLWLSEAEHFWKRRLLATEKERQLVMLLLVGELTGSAAD